MATERQSVLVEAAFCSTPTPFVALTEYSPASGGCARPVLRGRANITFTSACQAGLREQARHDWASIRAAKVSKSPAHREGILGNMGRNSQILLQRRGALGSSWCTAKVPAFHKKGPAAGSDLPMPSADFREGARVCLTLENDNK